MNHLATGFTADVLRAALGHAAEGLPVFPCSPVDKRPLTRHGFKDATADPDQIRRWWAKTSDALIGMPTGKRSGVWILDLDVDPDKGLDGVRAAGSLGDLPDTVTVRTPRGGLHCWFRWHEGIGNSPGRLPRGIDVRGEGGYVILPPSRRADGVSYEWEKAPGEFEVAEAPEWLLDLILRKAEKPEATSAGPSNVSTEELTDYASAALARECAAVATAAEGTRNQALNRAAYSLGQLVGGGMLSNEDVFNRLLAAAAVCGLPQDEADKTIVSGLAAGVQEPRTAPEPVRPRADGLKPFRDGDLKSAGFDLVGVHDYSDLTGHLLYQVLDYEHACGAEQSRMRRPGPTGSGAEWLADAGLVRVPYRWREVHDRAGETVYFTQTETEANRLAAAGLLATTLAGQKWTPEAAKAFCGRHLVLVLRNDDAGRKHEIQAQKALQGFAASIRTVRLPGLGRSEGLKDWFDAGHTVEELKDLAVHTHASGIHLSPSDWIDSAKIPLRRWLYTMLYICGFVSLIISTGGVGKSSLAIAEALAMVSGKPLVGAKPLGQLRVWYWNGEDPLDELHRRLGAAIKHYKLTADDIGDRLYISSGRATPIVIAAEEHRQVVVDELLVQEIIEKLRANKIDVIIIDPFVTCHRVNENDNAAIERVAKAWAHIAEAANCAVVLVHHTVKPHGNELTVDHGRGASALLAAARSARVINGMSKAEAKAAKIPEADRRSYFRADIGKANLMRPAEAADWFKLVSVDLGNAGPLFGDEVGVVTPWQYPKLNVPVVTPDDIRRCQEAIRDDGPWRKDQRAKRWVGIPIADALDLDPKADKAAIAKLVKDWLEAAYLKVLKAQDENSEWREYIRIGKEPKDD